MPSLLCLVAHPDDETILCGGTLALLAARGVEVHVVSLTRGEGGELGEPPLTDRAHAGAVREQEMVCAVGHLGGKSLSFLGYVDPEIGPGEKLSAPEHDPTMLAGQIVASLKQTGAQVLMTHGSNGEYGHPAHQLMHAMALAAAASLGAAAPSVVTFAAHYPDHPYPRLANAGDPADLVIDIGPFFERKVAAAQCHRTQHALFTRRRSEAAGRQLAIHDVLLREESVRRLWPPGPLAEDHFAQWVAGYTKARPAA